MFLNLLADEEELWTDWTCLVDFLTIGFGNQIVYYNVILFSVSFN